MMCDEKLFPAPWTLDVERGFIFPFRVQKPVVHSLIPKPHEMMDVHSSGLGLVMLVQYGSSPAGPYDELLYSLPIQNPTDGFELLATRHIPVIFVSSQASVTNGRINWGVPKNLAKFRWTVDSGYIFSKTTLTISTSENSKIIPSVVMYTINIPLFVHLGILKWACPLFMQKEMNGDGEVLPGNFWHAYKLGGCGWARPCIVFESNENKDQSSDESLFPSLRKLGAYVGIELCGNLTMPSPKRLVIDDVQKAYEGLCAHKRRVLCAMGVIGYIIYKSSSE